MPDLVISVGFDQGEIIRNILKLHVPEGKIDCDPTFSTGTFYRGTGVDRPGLRFDISPQVDGVVQADARSLPLQDASLSCLILDPPFLATKGRSLTEGEGNRINRRFTVFPDEKSLYQLYTDIIREAYRVLKPDGILIFKCQDKVSSGKQYLTHVFVVNTAVETGFYPKDLFVLLAKNRLVADWQARNQKHARKYHCYFIVFQKCKTRINY